MQKALILCTALLVGCGPSLNSERFEPISEQTYTRQCQYRATGYCYTCLPGFDGKSNCGMKMSSSCSHSGVQDVTMVSGELTQFWSDGTVTTELTTRERSSTPCQRL